MGWDTFWAIFSPTHLASLLCSQHAKPYIGTNVSLLACGRALCTYVQVRSQSNIGSWCVVKCVLFNSIPDFFSTFELFYANMDAVTLNSTMITFGPFLPLFENNDVIIHL
jgi:hypothetical protein